MLQTFLCPQALPGVESLRLGRLQPVTSATAAALARLPRLRRLDCTGGSLTEGAVAALATLPLSLTSLSLRECCSLSDARLAALLAGLPGLKEADLSLCAQLGDGALAQLGRCAQLAKIDLTGCERFRSGFAPVFALQIDGFGMGLLTCPFSCLPCCPEHFIDTRTRAGAPSHSELRCTPALPPLPAASWGCASWRRRPSARCWSPPAASSPTAAWRPLLPACPAWPAWASLRRERR